jgi:predicted metal-dependent hydrolase
MRWMRRNRRQYLKIKEDARELVHARVVHFNRFYGFSVGKIFIKNHKSRWGSCSQKGNLNFNYKIALLPPEIADYIVVHELCHLREFNHSPRFWRLVEEVMPDHRARRSALRRIERSTMAPIVLR